MRSVRTLAAQKRAEKGKKNLTNWDKKWAAKKFRVTLRKRKTFSYGSVFFFLLLFFVSSKWVLSRGGWARPWALIWLVCAQNLITRYSSRHPVVTCTEQRHLELPLLWLQRFSAVSRIPCPKKCWKFLRREEQTSNINECSSSKSLHDKADPFWRNNRLHGNFIRYSKDSICGMEKNQASLWCLPGWSLEAKP